jgi:pyruvate formate lyase activating enzyme
MEEESTLQLKEILARHTHIGDLYLELPNNKLECFACGHRCLIGDGKDGICRVRHNRNGKLYVPWGYVGALQLDPIEKKPFFHALPGSTALSFGMLGCDYHCGYCQNWITSQALRDPDSVVLPQKMTPMEFVGTALRSGAKVVTSTYNEPLITSEWGVEIFKTAKHHGLTASYVSNGNATKEVLEYLRPWVDLYKVDLKGFNDKQYRKLGGVLNNVLDTIRNLHDMKFWLEIVTLLIPGWNDSESEIRDVARFLVSVSPDIPWHVTAFHSDYKMSDTENTPVRTLLKAADIGSEEGLHYVYAGNIPGHVNQFENTYCHSCRQLLIERKGFSVLNNVLINGRCPKCTTQIPGYWEQQ